MHSILCKIYEIFCKIWFLSKIAYFSQLNIELEEISSRKKLIYSLK